MINHLSAINNSEVCTCGDEFAGGTYVYTTAQTACVCRERWRRRKLMSLLLFPSSTRPTGNVMSPHLPSSLGVTMSHSLDHFIYENCCFIEMTTYVRQVICLAFQERKNVTSVWRIFLAVREEDGLASGHDDFGFYAVTFTNILCTLYSICLHFFQALRITTDTIFVCPQLLISPGAQRHFLCAGGNNAPVSWAAVCISQEWFLFFPVPCVRMCWKRIQGCCCFHCMGKKIRVKPTVLHQHFCP